MENSRELILIADTVAKEKNISQQTVLNILAESIEVALRKNFPEGSMIQVEIDPKSGAMKAWRLFRLVDQVENIESEMLKNEVENEEVIDGYAWEPFDFKLTRQQFNIVKQVALQKIKSNSRDNYVNTLLDKTFNLHVGTVKGIKKEFFLIDINGTDIIIPKKNIPFKEVYKNGDRIRFMIKDQDGHFVGDRSSEEFLIELFKEEISAIENGDVQIIACSRNPGFRTKIIVSPKNSNFKGDAVRTCIGPKGSHIKNIQQELNGEYIDVIAYDKDPAKLLVNSISPVNVTKIVMDEDSKSMEIAVEEDGLSMAIGKNGKNIDMISRLLGWKIKVYSENEWENRQSNERIALIQYFSYGLSCDSELAEYIVDEGYTTIEELAYIPVSQLELAELDEETINALQENAKETFNDSVKNQHAEALKSLYMLGFDDDEVLSLINNQIYTKSDIADLGFLDLQDYLPNIEESRAKQIIVQCRQEEAV